MIVFDYLTSRVSSLFFHLTHQFHVQLVSFHVVLPNQVYYCYLHFEKQHFEIVQMVKMLMMLMIKMMPRKTLFDLI